MIMNDYRKLTKVTWKMYLCLFLASVFFILMNTTYMLLDSGVFVPGKSVETIIQKEISSVNLAGGVYTFPEKGIELSNEIMSFFPLGILFTMIGIFFMLFVREMSFSNIRSREYEFTFPIKKSALVIHEYISILLIIISVTFLQGLILMLFQNHYNNVWSKLAGGKAAANFVSGPIASLWTMMIIYCLILLILYTWIFLGMTLTKNSILGLGLSIVTFIIARINIVSVVGMIGGMILGEPPALDNNGIPYDNALFTAWESRAEQFEKICDLIWNIIFPEDIISDSISINGFMSGFLMSDFRDSYYSFSITDLVIIYIAFLISMIIIIAVVANKRDLSRGKVFYFRWTSISFAVICGLLWLWFKYEFMYLDVKYPLLDLLWVLLLSIIVYIIVSPSVNDNRKNYSLSNVDKPKVSVKSGELVKLFKYEWKKYFAFFVIGILFIIFNIVSTHTEYYLLDFKDIDLYDKDNFGLIVLAQFSDIGEMINTVFIRNVLFISGLLVVMRLVGYYLDRKSSVREFRESIAIRRKSKFIFHVFMDLILVALLLVVYMATEISVLQNNCHSNHVVLSWLPQSILGICITSFAYIFMIEALIVMIEQLFPNGMMRLPGLFGILLMSGICISNSLNLFRNIKLFQYIYGLFTLKLAGGNYFDVKFRYGGSDPSLASAFGHDELDVPVLYNGDNLTKILSGKPDYNGYTGTFSRLYDFSHMSSYIGIALIYTIIAVLLIAIAYRCSINKDHSKQIFYFEFEKYLFAGIISLTVLSMLAVLAVSIWHMIIIVIASVIMFFILVKLMTQRNTVMF